MRRLSLWWSNLRSEDEGATIVEYALLAALISVAAIIALTALGTGISDLFNKVQSLVAPAA